MLALADFLFSQNYDMNCVLAMDVNELELWSDIAIERVKAMRS